MRTNIPSVLATLSLAIATVLGACGDDTGTVKETPIRPDSGVIPTDGSTPATDANPDGGPSDCFSGTLGPTSTHEEIINACTTAEKQSKSPVLPLLGDGGALPALP